MKVMLYFIGGKEVQLDVDRSDWPAAFENALGGNGVIQVEDSEGGVIGINPRSVLYWKTATDSTEG